MQGPSPRRDPRHPTATQPRLRLTPPAEDALAVALRYHSLLSNLDRWSAAIARQRRDEPGEMRRLCGQAEAHARYLIEELSAFAERRASNPEACRAVPLLLDVTADARTPVGLQAVPLLIEEGATRMDVRTPEASLVGAMLTLLSLASAGTRETRRLSLTAARLSPLAARLSGLTKRAHLRLSVGAPTDAEDLTWRPSLVALRAAAVRWRGRLLRTANTMGGWRLCLDLPARDIA